MGERENEREGRLILFSLFLAAFYYQHYLQIRLDWHNVLYSENHVVKPYSIQSNTNKSFVLYSI